jgi:hypothetical protein
MFKTNSRNVSYSLALEDKIPDSTTPEYAPRTGDRGGLSSGLEANNGGHSAATFYERFNIHIYPANSTSLTFALLSPVTPFYRLRTCQSRRR